MVSVTCVQEFFLGREWGGGGGAGAQKLPQGFTVNIRKISPCVYSPFRGQTDMPQRYTRPVLKLRR